MAETTTATGFKVVIEEEALNDMRILEGLTKMQSEDSTDFEKLAAVQEVIELMLGKEQKKALYNHLVETTGRVKAMGENSVMSELSSIFQGISESKKK